MSLSSPDPKKNAIIPTNESGRGLPEGEPKIEQIKFYKVLCPRCRAMPGCPCFVSAAGKYSKTVTYFQVCIARILLYEAYQLGTVNELGIGKNGQMSKIGKE